jgi:hypothetical protein
MPITVNVNADALVSFAEWPDAPTLGEMHADVARWYGKHTLENAGNIEARLTWFTRGVVGLALETGGLAIMLLNVALG